MLTIAVLEPIDTTNLTYDDVVQLSNNVRQMMLEELKILTLRQRGIAVALTGSPFADSVSTGRLEKKISRRCVAE